MTSAFKDKKNELGQVAIALYYNKEIIRSLRKKIQEKGDEEIEKQQESIERVSSSEKEKIKKQIRLGTIKNKKLDTFLASASRFWFLRFYDLIHTLKGLEDLPNCLKSEVGKCHDRTRAVRDEIAHGIVKKISGQKIGESITYDECFEMMDSLFKILEKHTDQRIIDDGISYISSDYPDPALIGGQLADLLLKNPQP